MCQAAWLLTVAFGNLVVIIVAESSIFENRVCIRCIFTECMCGTFMEPCLQIIVNYLSE